MIGEWSIGGPFDVLVDSNGILSNDVHEQVEVRVSKEKRREGDKSGNLQDAAWLG